MRQSRTDQIDEIREREAVARRFHADPLTEIARHHSLPVMDRETRLFLRGVPARGVVLDVGGGWSWHWRCLHVDRPDVCVIVVDLVRENLKVAARLLGSLVNDQVFLVHGDALALPFPSSVFDGYWSVQTLQHIPEFERALREACRVLRPNGQFVSYSLNHAKLIHAVYLLMGRSYHVKGQRPGSFYLSRGSAGDTGIVRRVFGASVTNRYTEVLFHPDLKMWTGAAESWLGTADSHLSGSLPLLAWVARQRSYHTRKASIDC